MEKTDTPKTTQMIMLYKVISEYEKEDFEQKLEEYTNQYESYSVQYKPVCGGSGAIAFTALVMVPTTEEETIH